MNEKQYLKIIADLFRLTGYATGILRGLEYNDSTVDSEIMIEATIKYLEEQQNLILMQLGEKE